MPPRYVLAPRARALRAKRSCAGTRVLGCVIVYSVLSAARLTSGPGGWAGYETKAYNFSLDCESLPWMDRIRKAKGPLPGDGIV